jgi:type I restriction enzyme S subunit
MSVMLKPYPEYKDSGLPWLGNFPVHWKILRAKYIFREIDERSATGAETHLSMSQRYGLIDSSKIKDWRLLSESYIGGKICKQNDLVLNRLKAHLGVFAHAPQSGVVSPDYTVFRPIRADETRFFELVFKTPIYVTELRRSTKGIVEGFWRLYTDDFYDIRVPVPPQPEQCIILSWINQSDLRFRRLIRIKRQLIALLNEQMQAIIHRAVTRGLDSNVRLKPSGIDWLGDVPQNWEVGALRRFWEVVDCKHLTVPFVEDGIPLASVIEVQSFDLDLSHCKMTTEEWYQHLISGGRKPKRGDLIYCRNTSVGACAYVNTDIDFAMGQDVCLITSSSQNQRYLNYLLHSWFMTEQLERLLVGSTFKRINIRNIRALVVLVPPRSEQDAICHALDDGVVEIAGAIQRANHEIDFLREYRARLIADVVTGKLDVRSVELTALDEAETMEEWEIDEDAQADEMDEMEGVDS